MPATPNKSPAKVEPLSFENTEIAFKQVTDTDLKRAWLLFKFISINFFVQMGPPVTSLALKIGLPIKSLIRATIFKQFCGGEDIEECGLTVKKLYRGGVGTILDYSVEGEDEEAVFDETCREIIKTINRASGDQAIPLTVFKITGVGRFALLEKLDAGAQLTPAEQQEWQKVKVRVNDICSKAFSLGVPVMIDAEESWIQKTIDGLAIDMMRAYNQARPIVYNTYQLYRHDKLESLKQDYAIALAEGFYLGAKIVRGAYMEKERRRALEQGYPSPIQPDKEATDADYNRALQFCIAGVGQIALVAGTHNEDSCRLLADALDNYQIGHNSPHVYFSQLLGMSDNLSFNLAHAGYNVAKYVPYGPVKAVLPYLFRRAQENTAIAGQMSRELGLIVKEKRRRGI